MSNFLRTHNSIKENVQYIINILDPIFIDIHSINKHKS